MLPQDMLAELGPEFLRLAVKLRMPGIEWALWWSNGADVGESVDAVVLERWDVVGDQREKFVLLRGAELPRWRELWLPRAQQLMQQTGVVADG